MAANTKEKIKPESESAFNFEALTGMEVAADMPRMAVSEDGRLIYASESFYNLAGIKRGAKARKVSSIFSFKGSQALADIESGAHVITFKSSGAQYVFHFDWLASGDGKNYLIASQAEETVPPPVGDSVYFLQDQDDLRRFLNMSQDIMMIAETTGELIRVNVTFCEILGYAADDLIDMNFVDLFEEADQPYIRSTMQSFAFNDDPDQVIDFEARMKTTDGRNLWMEWRQQERGGILYLVGRDVTQTKMHEATLVRRKNQLSEAEAIGRMGHWRWVLGEDRLDWSDEIYRIFGVEKENFSPSIDDLNRVVLKRDVGRVVQGFQRAMIEKNAYDMEFRIKRPDGEVRFIHCEGRCELDSEGDVFALYGIMQDMTERNLYEAELRTAKDHAERAYAAKTQFLANMSHELRTPLNAIIGFSEMMQRELLGPLGTPQYHDYIKGIRESGEHLLDLISDILDMSKIEAGKYDLDLEEVSLEKVIKVASHMMEGRAMESGVKLKVLAVPDESVKIVADRRAVMQILLNIMSNAVKFTREGGQVTLECETREGGITLKISDNGIGIPPNKLQTITMPFEQASSSYCRDHEGTGLGLAITKELIEMHGGALKIESTVNVGTTVTVKLPFKPAKK